MMGRRSSIMPDEIIRYLHERLRIGQSLRSSAVRLDDAPLYNAAYKWFGTWPKTLEAAGLDPALYCRSLTWTPQKIVERIRKLNSRGKSLRRTDIATAERGLLAAAGKVFGTWQRAIEAAGINSAEYCTQARWTREQVAEAILLRAVKQEPLGSTTVRPYSLKSSAVVEFGSWANALRAVGLDPKRYIGVPAKNSARPEYTNREDIRKALLQRVALGLPCNQTTLKRQDRRLFRAALREYGTVCRAVRYAGIDRGSDFARDPDAGDFSPSSGGTDK